MSEDIVILTGGFDPIHSGHIEMIKVARSMGRVVIGLNSDEWLTRKKGHPFMPFNERYAVLDQFKNILQVLPFNDQDNSAKDAILKVRKMFPKNKIIFANGGDRTQENIPEMDIDDDNIEFVFGIGGENKKNSSSWILDKWKTNRTERDWGYWRVLDDKKTVKVKELVIMPGCSLSDQKHYHRSEHWYILEGAMKMEIEHGDIISTNLGRDETIVLKQHQTYVIHREDWHKAYNPFDKPCHVLEVQYGTKCVEDDIERR